MQSLDNKKSTRHVGLSGATKERLFILQNILFIEYRPTRTFLQRFLGGIKNE